MRLIAVQPTDVSVRSGESWLTRSQVDWILDWRNHSAIEELPRSPSVLPVRECPNSWDELQVWFRRAIETNQKLAIAYSFPEPLPPSKIWERLVGIAKYLSRTGKTATLEQLHEKLGLSDRALQLGLQSLCAIGFEMSAVRYMLDKEHPRLHGKDGDPNIYTLGEFGGHNVILACLPGT